MREKRYITFLEAMKAYIDEDCDVIFHGYEDEVQILFDADQSLKKLSEMTNLDSYTFFDLTIGKWSRSWRKTND